jgi:serine/threonine protein phosphatase PrpC
VPLGTGLKPDVMVALGRLELRDRDAFILCSDGLSNNASIEELRDLVLTSPQLDVACVRMIDLAKKRGGEDNVTVIVAGIDGDLPQPKATEPLSHTLHVVTEFKPVAPSAVR